VVGNEIIQINTFSYFGWPLSYEGKTDIEVEIFKFLKITGLINTSLNRQK